MVRWLMTLSRTRYRLARACWRMASWHSGSADRLLDAAKAHEKSGAVLWSRAMEARKAQARQVQP
jgi:hypothetical protein